MAFSNTVLFISYPFPPAVSAGVQRTLRFIKFLPEFGWKPVVLSVRPDVERVLTDDQLDDYLPAGVSVEMTPMWRPTEQLGRFAKPFRHGKFGHRQESSTTSEAGNSSISTSGSEKQKRFGLRQRLVKLLFETPDPKVWWAIPALRRALRMMRKHRPAVIYSTAPPHSSHLLACVVGVLTRRPVVLDFRDPWARSPWYDVPGGARSRRLDTWLESFCVRRAAAVLLNTDHVRDEFIQYYGDRLADKFTTLPNGFDPDQLAAIEQQNNPSLPSNGCLHLLHPGTIYGRRDLRPLFSAIEKLQAAGHSVRFEQVGLFKQDYDAQTLLDDLGIEESVQFAGVVSHSETISRMGAADALVLVQPDTPLQVPSKLYEMMMFDKPILALTGDGATADLVNKYRLGWIADPHDTRSIAAAIEAMSRQLASGSHGPSAAALHDFDGRRLTGRLAEVFTITNMPKKT